MRKNSNHTQSRSNVQDTKTQRISSQAIKIRCSKSKHKQSQAKNLQPYNLHVLEKANTEVLFLFVKVCRVSKVVVSQNKLTGLFFSPNSKCGTWKLEIVQLLKFEHPEFGFTSEQQHPSSHMGSQQVSSLAVWRSREWKMLSFPRKHNFQFVSGKELLYLMKEFWKWYQF